MSGADRPRSAPAGPPDQEARVRATTLFGRNLVVTAGAGTGKTAILVERTLNLVGSGTAGIEALALITFTEKAAAELRLRLGAGLDRLLKRSGGDESDLDLRRDADRSWTWLRDRGDRPGAIRERVLVALAALDAASVGTIHAFCLDLLRRHPRAAGIDPRAAVGEEAALERLLTETWDRFLRGPEGPAGRAGAWRAAVALAAAPEPARHLGRALARFALPAEALEPHPVPASAPLLAPVLDEAIASLRSLRNRATGVPPKMRGLLQSAERELAAVRTDGIDPARARSIAEFVRAHGSLPSAGAKLAGATPDEVKDTARTALELLKALARVDDDAVAAALDIARPFARQARDASLARGLVPFDAMLRLARDLLVRDGTARRRARGRFRQILVDEFQDTDPLQYEVLFLLARREPAHDFERDPPDPWRADLEPGRLFIVGDPKQSIYRFRGADIAAFRRAVALIEACGGESLALTASFRSPDRLLRPINRIFGGWLGPDNGTEWIGHHAPPYVRLEAAASAGPASGPARLSVWSIDAAQGAAAREGRRAEATTIAGHIRARVAAGDDRPGDFAILFRAATNIELYARALRRAGVPCLVDGGADFGERPEVIDLIVWLRAVASPNDAPALLAVLRSPLGAVPDAEMHRFVEAGGRLGPVDAGAGPAAFPAEMEAPALERALGRLEAFRRAAAGRPAEDVIRMALHDTPLLALHAAAHDGPERIARLRRAAAQARALAAEGLSLPEILTQWETAFVAGEEPGPLADETVDAVRLLTVHKAKGLEFKAVFVPDLGRAEAAKRPATGGVAWTSPEGGPGTAAIALSDGRTNAARVLHDLDHARHEEAEERRIFYVACTRAREELILVNSRRDRKAPWTDRLEVLGYAPGPDGSWPAEGPLAGGEAEHSVMSAVEPASSRTEPSDPVPLFRAAERHAAAARSLVSGCRPLLASPSGPDDAVTGMAGAESATPRRRSDGGRAARLAGSAVHAALARCDDFRNGPALLAAALEAARHLAAAESASPAGALTLRVEGAIRGILAGFSASSLPDRLASVDVLAREAPILHRDAAGQVWSGACDLLYRDEGGLVVADYKTGDPDEEGPETEARPHAAQLKIYVEAIRSAFPGENVRGEILFLRRGRAVPA